jgi:hypothetical protein
MKRPSKSSMLHVRIPANTSTDSEGNANSIPGQRRTALVRGGPWMIFKELLGSGPSFILITIKSSNHMGKQIQVYLMPDDVADFESALKSSGVLMLKRASPDGRPIISDTL